MPQPIGGYRCTQCGNGRTDVKDSRPTEEGNVRRRRSCQHCKAKFTTIEVPLELYRSPTSLAKRAHRAAGLAEQIATILRSEAEVD